MEKAKLDEVRFVYFTEGFCVRFFVYILYVLFCFVFRVRGFSCAFSSGASFSSMHGLFFMLLLLTCFAFCFAPLKIFTYVAFFVDVVVLC